VRQSADIVVREPDTVGADKVRAESAEVSEMAHQRLAPAVLAGDRLDFGFGQMGMQANAIVTRETHTACKEGITALARNGRRHGQRDAPGGSPWPARGRLSSIVKPPRRWGSHKSVHRAAQVRWQEIEQPRHGLIKHQVSHGWSDYRPQAHVSIGAHHRLDT